MVQYILSCDIFHTAPSYDMTLLLSWYTNDSQISGLYVSLHGFINWSLWVGWTKVCFFWRRVYITTLQQSRCTLTRKAPSLDTGCIAHFKKVSHSVTPLLNDSTVGTLQTTEKTYSVQPMKIYLLTIFRSDTMDGPEVVSSGHSHLPNFWILLTREYQRTEIWAIQPVSSRGAFIGSCLMMYPHSSSYSDSDIFCNIPN